MKLDVQCGKLQNGASISNVEPNMSRTNGKTNGRTNGKVAGFLKHTFEKGAVATTTSTLALAALGAIEDKDPAAPINAITHMLFGDEDAMNAEGIDAKHTLAGAGINAASVTMWAGVHELLFGRWSRKGPAEAIVSGAAVSALAYAVDYHVVPKRLTPGFEKKLSSRGLFTTYAVLALSFAAGALIANEKDKKSSTRDKKVIEEDELEMRPPV